MAIIIKSAAEIAAMRRAGVVVASILRILSSEIKAGMTTCQFTDSEAEVLTPWDG